MSRFLTPAGKVFLASICFALLIPAAGCSRYKTRNRVGNTAPVIANVEPLYQACLNRCYEQGALASYTRNGCLETCNELRRDFPWLDKGFSDYQSCEKLMDNLDLNRDKVIKERKELCERDYTHLHDVQGCRDAIDVFYENATLENVCGGAYTPHPRTVSQTAVLPAPLPARQEPVFPPLVRDTPKYSYPKKKRKQPAKPATAQTAPKPAEEPAAPAPAIIAPTPVETKDAPAPEPDIRPVKPAVRNADPTALPPAPEEKKEPVPEPPKPATWRQPGEGLKVQPGQSLITGDHQPIYSDIPPASPNRVMAPDLARQDERQ